MRHCRVAGAPLCALAFAAVPAAAQDHHEDQPIVVTATRTEDAVVETARRPGGSDVVAAEDYEDKLAISLRDALAFSPGVYTQPRFGQEIRISIRGSGLSRGFHMRGLTLLQDGVPINLADDNGDFQELDPLVLHHIEVYRGANAFRYGGSTLGGAVNGVTPTGRTQPGFDGRIDGGSYGTLRGKAAWGFADGRIDGWLALTGDRSSGERDHGHRKSLRFHGNVGFRLAADVETRFYASAQTIDQELPGALNLADAENNPKKGNFFGDQARDIDSIRLQNRNRIDLGDAALEVGAFVNLKDLHHPIFQLIDQESADWGLFARFDLVRGPVELRLGSTARFGTVDARRFVNAAGERGALTFEADQTARTVDLFGEGRYRIGTLSLIAGGIYSLGVRAQNQIFPAFAEGRAAFDQLSPRLGLLWEPRRDLQIFANYSRSHEMPGFIELAQISSFVPLDAQRAWTAEVGARGRIGLAAFDVSLYRARIEGELLQFTVGPDIPASTFNADRTLHQGVEAGLDLELARWARLRQVYQWNGFRFRGDPHYGDNRLPVAPTHLYRAELRLGSDRFNIAPAVEWVPEGTWADYANSLKVDGYAMLGASAEAEVHEGVSLFFDARNVTGSDAAGDISAVIQASPASVIFHPVERRALYGGVRARF